MKSAQLFAYIILLIWWSFVYSRSLRCDLFDACILKKMKMNKSNSIIWLRPYVKYNVWTRLYRRNDSIRSNSWKQNAIPLNLWLVYLLDRLGWSQFPRWQRKFGIKSAKLLIGTLHMVAVCVICNFFDTCIWKKIRINAYNLIIWLRPYVK